MPSDPIKASIRRKEKRLQRLAAEMQLHLPFPEDDGVTPKLPSNFSELVRQPARFPAGWWSRYLAEGFAWRANYQAEWIRKRREADLPAVIADPLLLVPNETAVGHICDLDWLERHPAIANQIAAERASWRKRPQSVLYLVPQRKTA